MSQEELQSKYNKLVEQRNQLADSLNRLETQKTQMVANINAHNGAITLLEELMAAKKDDASANP